MNFSPKLTTQDLPDGYSENKIFINNLPTNCWPLTEHQSSQFRSDECQHIELAF